jgi:hypothetical protein
LFIHSYRKIKNLKFDKTAEEMNDSFEGNGSEENAPFVM